MCKHCDWEAYAQKAEDVLESLDDLPSRASEFAEGVQQKLSSIESWVVRNKHITEPMKTAIDNMESGVNNWINH